MAYPNAKLQYLIVIVLHAFAVNAMKGIILYQIYVLLQLYLIVWFRVPMERQQHAKSANMDTKRMQLEHVQYAIQPILYVQQLDAVP